MKPNHTLRRAKVVCTLGPATSSEADILALAEAGMDVARFNFSHGTHDEHRARSAMVRRVSKKIGRPIAILQDLQGPKIRVGDFPDGPVELIAGESFTLTTRTVKGSSDIASVSYRQLHEDVQPGHAILLDDGLIHLLVERIDRRDIQCVIKHGGILRDHKGVNVPDAALSIEALTDKDEADLVLGMELEVDYIALSFVRRYQDILRVRQFTQHRGYDIPVIAKIEKPQAVDQIDKIIDTADGIMIARGDLGVELPPEEVPPIQKRIIARCNAKGVPVITATQMLDSMVHHPRPTRAEASDVANAILDGSDAVMLSAETAVGAFPVQTVETMARIIRLAESKCRPHGPANPLDDEAAQPYAQPIAIGLAATTAADMVDATAIIGITFSGMTARTISQFRPTCPILVATPDRTTYHRLALLWGVQGFLVESFHDVIDEEVYELINLFVQRGHIKPGDQVVLTAGLPFTGQHQPNMLRIEKVRA